MNHFKVTREYPEKKDGNYYLEIKVNNNHPFLNLCLEMGIDNYKLKLIQSCLGMSGETLLELSSNKKDFNSDKMEDGFDDRTTAFLKKLGGFLEYLSNSHLIREKKFEVFDKMEFKEMLEQLKQSI